MTKKIKSVSSLISQEVIEKRVHVLRGKRVMLDKDLAELYKVPTKVLIQSIKRNLKRFPSDFMYQVTEKEVTILRSQIVTSRWGGRRYLPYAFTEQGIAMLSSVLNSDTAIEVNIQIMRTFMKLTELAFTHKDLRIRIDELEKKYDQQFQVVFKAIKVLLEEKPKNEDPPKRF